MQFNYLCSLDQFVIGTANQKHDRLSLARMLMLQLHQFRFVSPCLHACVCMYMSFTHWYLKPYWWVLNGRNAYMACYDCITIT
jgi:hypothetical protein